MPGSCLHAPPQSLMLEHVLGFSVANQGLAFVTMEAVLIAKITTRPQVTRHSMEALLAPGGDNGMGD